MGSTGVYAITIIVGAEYGIGPAEVGWVTRVLVVNQSTSPIGRGWTLAGIQRLYPQYGLIVQGDGSAAYFSGGPNSFTSPAGDFSRLTFNGTSYVRAYPDSTKVTFTSSGLMTQVTDPWGNASRIVYDGANRVWKLLDPADTTRAITLTHLRHSRALSWGRAAGKRWSCVMGVSEDLKV